MSRADTALRVLHVAPAYYPATYWGGPTFSTFGLCNALSRRDDVEVTVLATDTAGPGSNERLPIHAYPERYKDGYDVYFVRKSLGVDIAPRLLTPLMRLARDADIIHLTATYSFPSLPTFMVARSLGKPLVWSPRGAIQATAEWEGARRRGLKRAWQTMARWCMPRNTIFHTTAEVEREACSEAFPGKPAVIIPNGVDIPNLASEKQWRPEGKLRLMYLGRLDVKKGLENLFNALKTLPANVTLDVYGTGDAEYSASLKAGVEKMQIVDRVSFHGHVEGVDKTDAFSKADLFVLPSFSENFGIVVAEALAHGVPVISSLATPWQGLETHGCGLWVENTPESLASAITQMADRDLADMGRQGRKWVSTAFAWDALAARLAESYRSLLLQEQKTG